MRSHFFFDTDGRPEPLRPRSLWSGRPGSNRRRPPWEGGILPLNYARLRGDCRRAAPISTIRPCGVQAQPPDSRRHPRPRRPGSRRSRLPSPPPRGRPDPPGRRSLRRHPRNRPAARNPRQRRRHHPRRQGHPRLRRVREKRRHLDLRPQPRARMVPRRQRSGNPEGRPPPPRRARQPAAPDLRQLQGGHHLRLPPRPQPRGPPPRPDGRELRLPQGRRPAARRQVHRVLRVEGRALAEPRRGLPLRFAAPPMTDLRDLLARYHAERGGSVSETADGVLELSAMFNGLTRHRAGYLSAHRLRRAYVHYYLPVNAEKVARVLREMDAYAPATKPPRVLDFGCGPGTAAIAKLLHGPVADLTLVDVVDEALDDARWFCSALGVQARAMHDVPDEKFDLILAANVFSERLAPLEEHLSDKGHLVVIEPALKESTRKLMQWRDDAVARGFKIAAPCIGTALCPMLERD